MKKTALFLALALLAVPALAKKFNPTNYPQTATICTFAGYNSTDKQAYSFANSVCIDSTGGVVFNEGGSALSDFRIEGDTEANLFFVDASADAIGVGTASPSDADGLAEIFVEVKSTSGDARVVVDSASGSFFGEFLLQENNVNKWSVGFGANNDFFIFNYGLSTNDLSISDTTGNISVSGTVDGRDLATDGTKLDGIASGAQVDTSANTICSGTGNYLDGEGNCDALVTDTSADTICSGTGNYLDGEGNCDALVTNSNAATICSGTTVYLDGEGNCDTLTLSGITGAGTSGKIVKYTGSTTVADSVMTEVSGEVGIGIATPDGTLHVHTATAGSVVADAGADDLVIEANGNGGMSILTPDASSPQITLGTPTDATGARISWTHSITQLIVGTLNSGGKIQLNSGSNINGITIDSSQDVSIPNGDLGIGSTTIPTANGGKILFFGDNTADPTMGSNTAGTYGKDVSGTVELFAVDEAGNATQLSPHDPVTGDWIFFSHNTKTGRTVRVNMERMIRKLEEFTGEKFLEESWE